MGWDIRLNDGSVASSYDVPDGHITTAKIADSAVTDPKLNNNYVSASGDTIIGTLEVNSGAANTGWNRLAVGVDPYYGAFEGQSDTQPTARIGSVSGSGQIALGPGASTSPTWSISFTSIASAASAASGNVATLSANSHIRSQTDPVNNNDLARKSYVDNMVSPAIVNDLPSSPADGDVVAYDTGSGAVWMFKYDQSASAAYPWKFLGGAPIGGYVNTAETTSTGSYGDLATVGPSAVFPLTGDYKMEWGSTQRYSAGITNNRNMYHAVGVASASAGDSNSARSAHPNLVNMLMSVHFGIDRPSIPAGAAADSQYRGAAGETAEFQDRYLRIIPVAVKRGA
jgi:hypothetical protein